MKRFLLVVATTILASVAVFAQTPTGTLSGTVTSPEGAVVPGATVEIKSKQTNKVQTAVSGDSGDYSFSQIEPGLYTVTVKAKGFKTFIANDVKVDIGREYTLVSPLSVGEVSEVVTVTAGADVITSTSAQVTSTVSPQQILSLPLLTRNPLSLTTLQAGVASNPFQNTSINGQRTSTTNITRDGISINDQFIRSNATDFAPGRPSVDDTGEFSIATTNIESDQGSGAAQISLVTPRGTKSFHGALFEYNRNSRFGANNFFNNRTPYANGVQPDIAKAPPFRNRNQYGGKIGGPFPVPGFGEGTPLFFRDKGYFFIAYEGIRDPLAARATRTILTPAARAGALTFNRAADGAVINSGGISCPTTTAGSICTVNNILAFAQAQGFTGIPNTIDPIIQARVLAAMPTAGNTTGGDSLNTTGYAFNRRQDTTRRTTTTRFDVDWTPKDTVNAVFNWNKENLLRPDVDTTGFSVIPEVSQYSKNKSFVLTYRRIMSASMVNEARWGIFTSEVPFKRTSAVPDFYLGAQGTTSGTLAGLVDQPNVFMDQGRNNKLFNLADNFNWVIGSHSLKFGMQLQRYKVNSYNDFGLQPNYIIGPSSATTFTAGNFVNTGGAPGTSLINATQLGTANNLLALMAGIVNGSQQRFNTVDPTSGYKAGARNLSPFRNDNHGFYVADRWSAMRGLTLSLGVRYELYPALKLANGLSLEPVIADLNNPAASLMGNGTYNVIGTNAGKQFLYYKTDYNNFAPNIGVAYSPHFGGGVGKFIFGSEGKSVIRGGYSQVYANDSIITSLNSTLSANVGLGGATNQGVVPITNSTSLNDRISGSLTPILPPAFVSPPRTFLQNNNQAGQGFFAVANAVDPKLQIPKTEQYSFGIQREFFGNTAVEVRYVGTRSKNLARGIDLNQIDIVNNGVLSDFQKAQANLALSFAQTGNINTATPFCAGVIAGCQALNVFQAAGSAAGAGRLTLGATGNVTLTQFRNALVAGTVADFAQTFVSNGLNNHPTVADPTRSPFVKLYPNPNIGQIELFTNAGYYSYHSLQMEIRRRFSQGLYFQANYTLSKNLTDTIGTSQQLFEPYLDNNRKNLDKQRADFDQTHVFNFNGIYQLPFGKGKWLLNQGGAMDKIFGGWELSGLWQWATGAPISFIDARGTFNRGARSGRQTINTTLSTQQIKDLTGIFEQGGKIYYLNPSILNANGQGSAGYIYPGLPTASQFAGQVFFNNGPGQVGTMGRTQINGPRYQNVNMALLKNVRFTESMRVQLRAEAFNVFNHVNLFNGAQLTSPTATTFGQILSAGEARIFQFAARFEF